MFNRANPSYPLSIPLPKQYSSVRLYGSSGFGSGLNIRLFTKLNKVGSAIDVISTSGDGTIVIARKTGIYYISYADYYTGGTITFCITKNQLPGELSTAPSSITDSYIIGYAIQPVNTGLTTLSTVIPLNAGDRIRFVAGAASDASDSINRAVVTLIE